MQNAAAETSPPPPSWRGAPTLALALSHSGVGLSRLHRTRARTSKCPGNGKRERIEDRGEDREGERRGGRRERGERGERRESRRKKEREERDEREGERRERKERGEREEGERRETRTPLPRFVFANSVGWLSALGWAHS